VGKKKKKGTFGRMGIEECKLVRRREKGGKKRNPMGCKERGGKQGKCKQRSEGRSDSIDCA